MRACDDGYPSCRKVEAGRPECIYVCAAKLQTRGMSDTPPKDCRRIQGGQGRIISRATAEYALEAMLKTYTKERLERMYADDRSFVAAAIRELQCASNNAQHEQKGRDGE